VSVKALRDRARPQSPQFRRVGSVAEERSENEAALAWARGSNWLLQNPNGEAFPICTHVIARFGG
jgi:hypothetical protein